MTNDGKGTLYSLPTLLGRSFKGIIWIAFSLPFVPLDRLTLILGHICHCCCNLRLDEAMGAIRQAILLLQDPAVEEWCSRFADYLEETWIHGNYHRSCCCCCCLSFQFVFVQVHIRQRSGTSTSIWRRTS